MLNHLRLILGQEKPSKQADDIFTPTLHTRSKSNNTATPMRFKRFKLSSKSNHNILLEANVITFSVLDAVSTEAIQAKCSAKWLKLSNSPVWWTSCWKMSVREGEEWKTKQCYLSHFSPKTNLLNSCGWWKPHLIKNSEKQISRLSYTNPTTNPPQSLYWPCDACGLL